MFGIEFDEEYNKEEIILSVVLTIFNICTEHKVQLFLENAIIKNSILDQIQYNSLKNELLSKNNIFVSKFRIDQTNEMILLKDSDLYTVINYLMRIGSSRINKIWVQVIIKQKFLSLIKKYFHCKDFHIFKSTIRVFKSMKEFTPRTLYNMNIMSIWSEDLVYARYLATVLNRDVIFVNMHMDFYGGNILLPYVKVFGKIYEGFKLTFNDDLIQVPSANEVNLLHVPDKESMPICNLFYDGKWHKPVKNMYWKRNNMLWANATKDDIKICFNSAIEGFKIWKNWSVTNRIDVLSQMITILNYNSKFSKNASKLTVFSNFTRAWLLCSQNDRLEVIQSRIPRGVIILKEKSEEILILRLIQILISGNSVIVIADKHSCSLAPYCDIFSTSKIPRGVINFLYNQNTKDLELSLCATDYVNYEKQLFTSNFEKMYINLTLSKQIVLSLK
ncbi:PREDICTED: uncharacterized protein LOC108763223 [Trachymyrmex cornetzi]|uniref:uncharacterized protein LOC108763223 n=1 Tax=Trachymyrmex cornetzi TaxID=471704 RepID=UPI00084F6480|nr:PREDICTED: uncharacterized protein LOC108763223 [Trachymyrmex cornetzi]